MEEFIIEDETGTLNAASAMQETGREVDLRLEHALLARAIVETNARRNPLEGAESHGGHTGNAEGLRIHSFVDRETEGVSQEGKVIQTFFNTVEKHVPQLVSWNGGGFDLPVLHYRGLKHGVVASKYWDMGEGGDHDSRDFKWNNFISRYHMRHLDLMDLLAMYQPKNNAPLDAMAKLCGFPGKLGMDGSAVYPAYLNGQLEEIRRYCETDVMNTYLLYCRFQKMRGGLLEAEYEQEIAFVKESLGQLAPHEPHWQEYLAAWA